MKTKITIERMAIVFSVDISTLFLAHQGNPMEESYKEYTERGPTTEQLAYCFNSYREAALSKDPKFDHIEVAEKQKVRSGANLNILCLHSH